MSARSPIENLIPLLEDPYPSVRAIAVRAIGNMGEPAKFVVPQLILMLNDADSEVVTAARLALSQLKYHQ